MKNNYALKSLIKLKTEYLSYLIHHRCTEYELFVYLLKNATPLSKELVCRVEKEPDFYNIKNAIHEKAEIINNYINDGDGDEHGAGVVGANDAKKLYFNYFIIPVETLQSIYDNTQINYTLSDVNNITILHIIALKIFKPENRNFIQDVEILCNYLLNLTADDQMIFDKNNNNIYSNLILSFLMFNNDPIPKKYKHIDADDAVDDADNESKLDYGDVYSDDGDSIITGTNELINKKNKKNNDVYGEYSADDDDGIKYTINPLQKNRNTANVANTDYSSNLNSIEDYYKNSDNNSSSSDEDGHVHQKNMLKNPMQTRILAQKNRAKNKQKKSFIRLEDNYGDENDSNNNANMFDNPMQTRTRTQMQKKLAKNKQKANNQKANNKQNEINFDDIYNNSDTDDDAYNEADAKGNQKMFKNPMKKYMNLNLSNHSDDEHSGGGVGQSRNNLYDNYRERTDNNENNFSDDESSGSSASFNDNFTDDESSGSSTDDNFSDDESFGSRDADADDDADTDKELTETLKLIYSFDPDSREFQFMKNLYLNCIEIKREYLKIIEGQTTANKTNFMRKTIFMDMFNINNSAEFNKIKTENHFNFIIKLLLKKQEYTDADSDVAQNGGGGGIRSLPEIVDGKPCQPGHALLAIS